MNLLLLDASEVANDGRTVLEDRRARHLIDVLGVAPGSTVRAGLLDGPLGVATVLASGPLRVELRCSFEENTPSPPRDTLLLAVPRPKVLRRCLEHAAALGFGRIVLVRTWRVDKSHMQTRELDGARLRHWLRLGLEQGARTRMPDVVVEPRFRPFVEDRLDALVEPRARFAAHPAATKRVTDVAAAADAPIALAIGPERGFTDFEIERLAGAGFTSVRAGDHPLRVETALAFVFGQLTALRSAGGRG